MTKVGDPYYGCAKEFEVGYFCGSTRGKMAPDRIALLSAEAGGKTLYLSCL